MPIPKLMGRDCELSTTGLTPEGRTLHSWRVTRHVLANIDAAFEPVGGRVWTRRSWWQESGPTGSRYSSSYTSDAGALSGSWQGSDGTSSSTWQGSQSIDALRHWASSGQCYYSDMSHLEVCTAETLDPRKLAAQCLSNLQVCEVARKRAEAEAEPGTTYALTTANVDIVDPGVSWGTHFNVAVEPDLWEDLFDDIRRPARLGFVSSALAALIPFFGAGYVLPLRSGPRLSLSARAHHLTRLSTLPTTETYARGLLNARREPHAQGEDRLHLIGFDLALASGALLASTLQCCLAAAELGFAGLGLYEPVRALGAWSLGLDATTGRLTGVARLADGERITLPLYMRRLVSLLIGLVDDGSIPEEVAPGASELLPKVLDLTHFLEEGSLDRYAPHLDWAAKLLVLVDLCRRDGMKLDDMPIRVADHDYASSDPSRGHFWKLWEQGRVDPLVSHEDVEACLLDGPEDGRGWARGRLIRDYGDRITDVNWSHVELRGEGSFWGSRVRVEMPRPSSLSRDVFEPVLAAARDVEEIGRLLPTDPVESPEVEAEGDLRAEIVAPAGGVLRLT
ncbi:MAG: proteasome accessory factor PafA2 family protein [Gemmatimonadetes bacterium]|nr:proteasome accessory factor PafA2 family protein [Gemmatimonadota bacterium]